MTDDFDFMDEMSEGSDLDMMDIDDYDLDSGNLKKQRKHRQMSEEEIEARAHKTKMRNITMRAESEQRMNEILDWHLEEGMSYHIISGGDIDALTYMRGIVKQQHVKYALISSWVFAMEDAEEIASWLAKGYVDRVDVYTGELSIQHYRGIFDYFGSFLHKYGGRIVSFRNHAKVMVILGDEFDVVIESSANVNRNPRSEQTTITVDSELCQFYKTFYDERSSKDWPYEWHPWERKE